MIKKELKLLLSKNKTQKVIDKLLSLTEVVNDNNELFDEVILLSSRYESCLTERRLGRLSFQEVQLQLNNINDSLIQAIQRLPDETEQTNRNIPINKKDKVIELLIDQEFYGFDSAKKENLIGVISGLLNIQRQEVIIRRVSNGSVKVTIEMPKKSAIQLVKIFKLGTSAAILQEVLKIKSVALKGWGASLLTLKLVFGAGITAGIIVIIIMSQNHAPSSLSVHVYDKDDKENPIWGKVALHFDSSISLITLISKIDSNGMAIFSELPDSLIGKESFIHVELTQPVTPEYRWFVLGKQKIIDFPVTKLEGKIFGVVKDESGKPLKGVKVRLRDTEVFTNSLGHFLLRDTAEKVNIEFFKKGYLVLNLQTSPYFQDSTEIILTKN